MRKQPHYHHAMEICRNNNDDDDGDGDGDGGGGSHHDVNQRRHQRSEVEEKEEEEADDDDVVEEEENDDDDDDDDDKKEEIENVVRRKENDDGVDGDDDDRYADGDVNQEHKISYNHDDHQHEEWEEQQRQQRHEVAGELRYIDFKADGPIDNMMNEVKHSMNVTTSLHVNALNSSDNNVNVFDGETEMINDHNTSDITNRNFRDNDSEVGNRNVAFADDEPSYDSGSNHVRTQRNKTKRRVTQDATTVKADTPLLRLSFDSSNTKVSTSDTTAFETSRRGLRLEDVNNIITGNIVRNDSFSSTWSCSTHSTIHDPYTDNEESILSGGIVSESSTPALIDGLPSAVSSVALSMNKHITILVNDTERFHVCPSLFTCHPNTFLGRMFGQGNAALININSHGEFPLEAPVSPDLFRCILDFYSTSKLHVPPGVSMAEVKAACDYFLIPFSVETIKSPNLADLMHELSNQGCRRRFENFLELHIQPVMGNVALTGERECHLVFLVDDDIIDWDSQFPPGVGEEFVKTIRCSELCRFFRFFENRECARDLLKEKGLKKIKTGIEGFPTSQLYVKNNRKGDKTEIVYNYEQRPFLKISWERADHKSRHVDFQCLRPIVTSTLSEADAD